MTRAELPGELKTVRPAEISDWNELVENHPDHSLFHTRNWANVLMDSYGCKPQYIGQFNQGHLEALMPIMALKSPVTGHRGISLPYSDYCYPLLSNASQAEDLFNKARAIGKELGWRFIQIRGNLEGWQPAAPYKIFNRHTLALSEDSARILKSFRSNYRRKIRKAEKADLTIKLNRSSEAMEAYFKLHCLTRKRHGLPPQPHYFFKNIFRHVIDQGLGFIVLAYDGGEVVAGSVYLHFGKKAIYKFGASTDKARQKEANFLVMWRAIEYCCQQGISEFCFGRTGVEHKGLNQYKDGWGADCRSLLYYQYDLRQSAFQEDQLTSGSGGYGFFRKMPMPLLKFAGTVLYPHIG